MDLTSLRKMLAGESDDYRAYYTDAELAETPAERKARLSADPVEKGTCPKCRTFIGRGVAMHSKHCKA